MKDTEIFKNKGWITQPEVTKEGDKKIYSFFATITTGVLSFGGAGRPNYFRSSGTSSVFTYNRLSGMRLETIQVIGGTYASVNPLVVGADPVINLNVLIVPLGPALTPVQTQIPLETTAGDFAISGTGFDINLQAGEVPIGLDGVAAFQINQVSGVTPQLATNPAPTTATVSFSIIMKFSD